MKKMMFTLAMVSGLSTIAAFANSTYTKEVISCSAVAQGAEDFTPIELKDLPLAVQEGLVKNFSGSLVKAAAVATDEATKTTTYKVTLTDAEGNEQTVFLTDKGEVVNPNPTDESGK